LEIGVFLVKICPQLRPKQEFNPFPSTVLEVFAVEKIDLSIKKLVWNL